MSAVCFVSRYTEPTPNNAKHSYSNVLNKLHHTLLHSATLSYTTPQSPTLLHILLHCATLSYTTPYSLTLLHTLLQLSNGK